MSEMVMIILLACSIPGITYGKNICRDLKMGSIWKCQNIKHSFNLTSDMQRSSQIIPESVFLMLMTSSMTSQGDLKVALYIHV